MTKKARREHTDREQKSFRNAAAGFSRLSAIGQRKYPAVKEKSKITGKMTGDRGNIRGLSA
jgi:hypothetical protein